MRHVTEPPRPLTGRLIEPSVARSIELRHALVTEIIYLVCVENERKSNGAGGRRKRSRPRESSGADSPSDSLQIMHAFLLRRASDIPLTICLSVYLQRETDGGAGGREDEGR